MSSAQWDLLLKRPMSKKQRTALLQKRYDEDPQYRQVCDKAVKELKEKADNNELIVMEYKEQVDALQQTIATLEQQKEQANNTQQELKQQLNELQQAAKQATPKGFWSGLASFFKNRE